MSSTGSRYYSSKYPVSVVNDRSPSTSSRYTMSSSGTYSSSGASSDYSSSSSRDSSPNVTRDTYRAYTSQNYTGNSVTRTTGHGDVTVLNHHSRVYNQNDPHPGYGTPTTDRNESKRSTRS